MKEMPASMPVRGRTELSPSVRRPRCSSGRRHRNRRFIRFESRYDPL